MTDCKKYRLAVAALVGLVCSGAKSPCGGSDLPNRVAAQMLETNGTGVPSARSVMGWKQKLFALSNLKNLIEMRHGNPSVPYAPAGMRRDGHRVWSICLESGKYRASQEDDFVCR